MSLQIGSVSIEALESLDLDQTYEILGGRGNPTHRWRIWP